MHRKKIGQVKEWLEQHMCKSKRGILLLSGPTGTGKTALVHNLCRHLSIRIIEPDDEHPYRRESIPLVRGGGFKFPALAFVSLSSELSPKGVPHNEVSPDGATSVILLDNFASGPGYYCHSYESLLLAEPDSGLPSAVVIVTDPVESKSPLRFDPFIARLLERPAVTLIQYQHQQPAFFFKGQIRSLRPS